MAAGLTTHQPINFVKTQSGNDPLKLSFPEKAGQLASVVMPGVPLELSSGYAAIWDGITLAKGIVGIATGYGQNLATDGAGAPVPPFGPVTGSGAIQTWGSVQNQPNAHNIAPGTPMATGRQEAVHLATGDTWFEAQIDNSSTGTAVTARTLVGGSYGLTVDASGYWYVDLNKTAGNAVLVIKELNPLDPIGTAFGRVWFAFLAASYQLGS
jgi:hypothetical protein